MSFSRTLRCGWGKTSFGSIRGVEILHLATLGFKSLAHAKLHLAQITGHLCMPCIQACLLVLPSI